MTTRHGIGGFLTGSSFPAQLGLAGTGGDVLACETVVRELPGRRLVCRAVWRGQAVYAKLYTNDVRGRRHWRREQRGARWLAQNRMAAPVLLYSGELNDNLGRVNVFRAIEPALTIGEAWDQAATQPDRAELLQRGVTACAMLHACGLRHTDPHPGNFLVTGEDIAILDAGAIRRFRGRASEQPSLDELGLFLAQFPGEIDTMVEEVFSVYASRRGWSHPREMLPRLWSSLQFARMHRQDRYLKKIYRECTEFIYRREPGRMVVCRRDAQSAAMTELLDDPDASLGRPDSVMLKEGGSSTVWRVGVGGSMLVVKRYNIKNSLHGLRRAMRRSRASVSWEQAHRLRASGLATPQPIALVEERRGPFRQRAWLVTEYVAGEDAVSRLQAFYDHPEKSVPVFDAMATCLSSLQHLHLSHGDMKATNWLLRDDVPVLLDLDAMRRHYRIRSLSQAQRKDLRRFLRNWSGTPLEEQARQALIRAELVNF